MHAMLALSASHLEKLAPSCLTVAAQNHRLAAMKGLNEALVQPITSSEEGDAAIATCYALLMQSWYTDDGLQTFLVVMRSCDYTSKWVREQKIKSVLSGEDEVVRLDTMKGRFKDAPKFNENFTERGLLSLQALELLCEHDVHFQVFDALKEAYESFAASSFACMTPAAFSVFLSNISKLTVRA